MIDCTKCKNFVEKQDTRGMYCECLKDLFLEKENFKQEFPTECKGFELKGFTEEEIEIMRKMHACPVEGLKYDSGKNRMGLVLQGFSNALWEVGRVGTFGCQKYGENSWQNLDNAKSRYLDALCRHLFKHLQGEKVDKESGLLHLSHIAWNCLALLEFELKDTMEFGTEKGLQQACDMAKKFLKETESEEE